MKTILYIHGFNSAGTGKKAEDFKRTFAQCKVVRPTFNYKDLDAALKTLNSTFIVHKPDIVVGTSMGGFLALYASAKYNVKAVAINPVTKPFEVCSQFLGEQKNFVTKEVYTFTQQDADKYKMFTEKEFNKIVLKNQDVKFLLATDDELLGDHTCLEQLYPQCKDFNYYTGLGHRFNSIKTIQQALENWL